jgi:hypothetical protein
MTEKKRKVEKGRRRKRKVKKVLRPEYEKALKQSMKEFDTLLRKLAKL